ncbi:MAG: hypothetical protein F4X51_15700 [Gemmatimonadetes bacterium]|nr:hypothetical protein [Gemmatimonadota bacterium]
MSVFKSLDRRQFTIFMLKSISILNFGNLLFFFKNAGADEETRSRSTGTARNGRVENAVQFENTDDVRYEGQEGQNYGNNQLHDAVTAASDSTVAHGNDPVVITAIGVDGGGPMPGSTTHQNGTCYDIRIPGNNGEPNNVNLPTYDREATEDLIQEMHEQQPIVQVIIGDSTTVANLREDGIPAVYDSGNAHDNHIHVQFQNPDGNNGGNENEGNENEGNENEGNGG